MKLLTTFCLCFVVFGMSFADNDYSKKKNQIVSFYKCIACAPKEAQDAYAKCEGMKPEKAQKCSEMCMMETVGEKDEEGWKHLCENPDDVEKVFDCLAEKKEGHLDEFTGEDKEGWNKFKDCAEDVKEKYCSEDD